MATALEVLKWLALWAVILQILALFLAILIVTMMEKAREASRMQIMEEQLQAMLENMAVEPPEEEGSNG